MYKYLASCGRRWLSLALKLRPVPQHIAFIMDGNRRFAVQNGIDRCDGHSQGYKSLIDALGWCLDLGVICVSVYAFSIDNYSRSEDEVAALMKLAEEKLRSMVDDLDLICKQGVKVQVIGDLTLAPAAVQSAASAVMTATAHNNRATLNICFSYTSSQEMERAITASSLQFEEFLSTSGNPDVDLLIRTSGERRLSDFLLWQSRHALLVFTNGLWPDFNFLDLCSAILEYQQQYKYLALIKTAAARGTWLSEDCQSCKDIGRVSPISVASPPGSPSSKSSSITFD